MRPSRDHDLERLAEALADGTAIDWTLERSQHTGGVQGLAGLELLEAVSRVFEVASTPCSTGPTATKAITCTAPPTWDPPFTWGPLRVVERIGEGSFGEVFRALDPTLGREVALKLRKDVSTGNATSQWLAEARRLARVRHPNVVTIHGADTHNGREGLWTDLLVGETLRERLRRLGPLPGEELLDIGVTLSRALTAIHGAGVVHGDIKASNVVREADGTLILLDLGSGSELFAPKAVPDSALSSVQNSVQSSASPRPPSLGPQGSPLTSAPEVLQGEAATVPSDLYSLGAMLFLLATNQPPYVASSLEELRSLAGSGERAPLRSLRNDLAEPFILAVERSLAVDPDNRFAGAEAFATALRPTEIEEPTATPTPVRRSRPAILGSLMAAIVLLAGLWWHQSSPTNEAALVREWDLVRVGNLESPLRDGSKIGLGDPLSLEVLCAGDTYLYLLNEDQDGNVFVLFPLPEAGPGNPLSAGRHRLPGTIDGIPQNWIVTSSGGDEHFLLVAAASPLPTVERFVAKQERASAYRRPQNQFAAQSRPSSATEREPDSGDDVVRGVGGLVPRSDGSASQLAALVDALKRDREDVCIEQLRLSNPR